MAGSSVQGIYRIIIIPQISPKVAVRTWMCSTIIMCVKPSLAYFKQLWELLYSLNSYANLFLWFMAKQKAISEITKNDRLLELEEIWFFETTHSSLGKTICIFRINSVTLSFMFKWWSHNVGPKYIPRATVSRASATEAVLRRKSYTEGKTQEKNLENMHLTTHLYQNESIFTT